MHLDAPVTTTTGLNMANTSITSKFQLFEIRRFVSKRKWCESSKEGGRCLETPVADWLGRLQCRTRATPSRKYSARAHPEKPAHKVPLLHLPHLLPFTATTKSSAMASRTAVSSILRARAIAATRSRAVPSALAARRRGYASESQQHSVRGGII